MGKQQIEWVIDDVKSTIVDRGKERDLEDGERTIPRCVVAFNSITGHKLSNEDGWLFMQVLKMCRSVQGAYKYDDYRDGVGYAALRAEEAMMTDEKRQKKAALIAESKKLTEQMEGRVRQLTEEERKKPFGKLNEHSNIALCECGAKECIRARERVEPSDWAKSIVPPECDTRGGA